MRNPTLPTSRSKAERVRCVLDADDLISPILTAAKSLEGTLNRTDYALNPLDFAKAETKLNVTERN